MKAIAHQTDSHDGPEPETAAARPLILAAARHLAERQGVLGLTLPDVAEEAGVAPEAVYSCFNSKNDLLLSVIADDLGTLARAMRGTFPAGDDENSSRDAQVAQLPVPVATDAQLPAGVPPVVAEDDAATSAGAIAAIAKLQQTVARLETRPVDAWLEQRLREFERAIAALEGRRAEEDGAGHSVEERFRELNQEIESLETRLQTAAEDAARSLAQRIVACEDCLRGAEDAADKPPLVAAGTESAEDGARSMSHVEPESAGAEPIVAATSASAFLAAARKSAQAASATNDTRTPGTRKRTAIPTSVYLAMGGLFLFVAFLTAAGLLLHKHAAENAAAPGGTHSGPAASGVAPSAANLTPQQRLRMLAEAGDAKAELLMGQEYLDGNGSPKNAATAFAWFSRAAARNEPIAQYELGVLYQSGRGVTADATQAFRWFEAAALKGNRRAMHSLATAYAEGWGTEKNLFESARWYGRAAQLGAINDQFNLGVLFERGMGVAQSLPDAYKWYAIAAAQGDRESQSRIAAIAPMLAPGDLAAAQNMARAYKPDVLSAPANVLPTLVPKR